MKFKYWLTSLTDISNAKKKLLHDCGITAEKLFFMPKNELFDILFFTDDDRKIILESRASYDVEKEWILFQQKDIGFVTMEDEAYPDKLRDIHNPPYSLFYIGALPDKSRKSVAIVGARGRSAYGCEVAKVLAAALSRQGIQIISGMARGIDRDAHMGCLEAGGNTYAVLGSGADTCYPKENRFLYDKIKVSGGIISELMPGTDPQKMFFPMRNRIISGLSDIVVIVEAKKRSGSLITADFAMGGGLFFAEPMMNGGMLLCIVQSVVYIAILVWAFNKKNSYHAYVIIPFSILIFRFAWYATCAGLVKMLIYYVPFVYFVSKKIK